MSKFYIQSYYQYPVTFSSIGKTIPARSAQGELRNVAEFTEKEIDTLKKREPFFRELVDKKKIRVLDHLPASYVPPAQRINEANDEAEKLRKENEALKAQVAHMTKQLETPIAERGPSPYEAPAGDQDDGLEGDRGRDAVAGVDEAAESLTDEDRKKQYEEMTYAELQDACKYAGIEYKNKKKAVLIEELVALKK